MYEKGGNHQLLKQNKDADLVLLDEEANVIHFFARGKQVK